MKTIFITLFQGVEAKNILRTDIYKELIKRDSLRLVFLVGSESRADFYRKEFSRSNIFYEVVEKYKPSRISDFFSNIKFLLLRTDTGDIRRELIFETGKSRLWFVINFILNRILANGFFRSLARYLDYRLVKDSHFRNLLEKYRPDLVLCAHIWDDRETQLLREAKRRGIKTVVFVNSWDKLTARGIIRIIPDRLLVFNNEIENEAMRSDISESRITVVGIPQYDWHIQHRPLSREQFCLARGLDPKKKLIVYGPMGKAFSNSDWNIIDLLKHSIANNLIPNSQLFVRFQPNDEVEKIELEKRPWLKYERPGIKFEAGRGVDWDMSFDEIKGLTDTLANTDVYICYASSMSIDAAIFDKPVINIDFEVEPKESRSKSPTYFYRMTHYKKALATGGIAQPKSPEELIKKICTYLENPALDREGREKLVREQCGDIDGRAGWRIADFLLKQIHD